MEVEQERGLSLDVGCLVIDDLFFRGRVEDNGFLFKVVFIILGFSFCRLVFWQIGEAEERVFLGSFCYQLIEFLVSQNFVKVRVSFLFFFQAKVFVQFYF